MATEILRARTLLFGGTPTVKHFPFGHQGAVHPGGSLPPVSKAPGVGWDPGGPVLILHTLLWRQPFPGVKSSSGGGRGASFSPAGR